MPMDGGILWQIVGVGNSAHRGTLPLASARWSMRARFWICSSESVETRLQWPQLNPTSGIGAAVWTTRTGAKPPPGVRIFVV